MVLSVKNAYNHSRYVKRVYQRRTRHIKQFVLSNDIGGITMDILKTERLRLRTLKAEDIDAVMSFWGNDEVMKYCGGSSGDRSRIANAIRNYISMQEERGFSVLAVTLQGANEVIGACGYNYTKDKNEIELIYHFNKEYWGMGYATEAARAWVEYASEGLNVNKIIASVDPRHGASRRVLEKLGFKYTGTKWFEETKQEDLCYELII